jgi:DNA-binding MarR family transcriptional regulator
MGWLGMAATAVYDFKPRLAVRRCVRKLLQAHGLGIDAYGALVTMIGAPGARITIGELGERRNLTPSGISRAVDKLEQAGLVERTTNPADERSRLVGLAAHGVERLREAQVTHHATVRELMLDRLDERYIETLGEVWEKAMPSTVSKAHVAALRCRQEPDELPDPALPTNRELTKRPSTAVPHIQGEHTRRLAPWFRPTVDSAARRPADLEPTGLNEGCRREAPRQDDRNAAEEVSRRYGCCPRRRR